MTDQKYKDLMNGGWSYPKKESTDPEEVKKVVDKYLTDNKIDSETIDKKITDGVSKIVADAPEDFDTLKEMSDWISEHEDSAAAMNSAILDNKSGIETLQTSKANATDVETLSGEVENNTNAISEIEANITTVKVRLEFEKGDLDDDNGLPVNSTEYKRTINYIKVIPNTEYTISRSNNYNLYVFGFQSKGIAVTDGTGTTNKFVVYNTTETEICFTTTSTTQYIKLVVKNLDLSEKITFSLTNSIGETVADNMNNIGDINHNLDNLSYGETAGGKNLFKIDTTNWTLTDNGIKNNAKNDGYLLGKIKLFAGKTYKIYFLVKSVPTASTTFTAYIDGSEYSNYSFVRIDTYGSNIKVERDYTATSDCELLYRLWGNSNSDIFEFQLQVEEGTIATDYEPYIPSVKMIADDVSNINSSMSDYGLNNLFDGEFIKGRYNKTTNIVEYNANFLCCKNKISCNSGDKITLKTTKLFNRFFVHFFNSGTYVSTYDGVYMNTAGLIDTTIDVPADVDSFIFEVTAHEVTTIVSYGHIGVYVNNQIDVVKNDVDALRTAIGNAKITVLATGGQGTKTVNILGDGKLDSRKSVEIIITSQVNMNVEKILMFILGDLSAINWCSLGGTASLVSNIELSNGELTFTFTGDSYWGDITFVDHCGTFTFTQ